MILLQVCRGTAVMLVSPTDGTDEIANPFVQPDGAWLLSEDCWGFCGNWYFLDYVVLFLSLLWICSRELQSTWCLFVSTLLEDNDIKLSLKSSELLLLLSSLTFQNTDLLHQWFSNYYSGCGLLLKESWVFQLVPRYKIVATRLDCDATIWGVKCKKQFWAQFCCISLFRSR